MTAKALKNNTSRALPFGRLGLNLNKNFKNCLLCRSLWLLATLMLLISAVVLNDFSEPLSLLMANLCGMLLGRGLRLSVKKAPSSSY